MCCSINGPHLGLEHVSLHPKKSSQREYPSHASLFLILFGPAAFLVIAMKAELLTTAQFLSIAPSTKRHEPT
jgi:hypothetical protein